MPSLVQRAEQAVLGALLYDHTLLSRVPYLTVGDFDEPAHQEIFVAINEAHQAHPATPGNRFIALAAANVPAIDATYLHELPELCPQPVHVTVYARMVIGAALIRELDAHADRIARGAADLDQHADRLRMSGAVAARERAFPGHLARLAQVMKQHAIRLDPDRADTAGREPEPIAYGWPADPQARREAGVLADLIQHPAECEEIMAWLPAQAFTPGPHREIYEAMRAVVRSGTPVDPLTVAWQLGTGRASATITGFGQAPGSERNLTDADPEYVFHLANLPVEPGSAIMNGGIRLADHIRSELSRGAYPDPGDAMRERPGNRRHPPRIAGPRSTGPETRSLMPPSPSLETAPDQDGHHHEPRLK